MQSYPKRINRHVASPPAHNGQRQGDNQALHPLAECAQNASPPKQGNAEVTREPSLHFTSLHFPSFDSTPFLLRLLARQVVLSLSLPLSLSNSVKCRATRFSWREAVETANHFSWKYGSGAHSARRARFTLLSCRILRLVPRHNRPMPPAEKSNVSPPGGKQWITLPLILTV